ncbi:NAD(P)H-dependent oxidoreductase [Alloalcanivorax sp. C16-2]|uniref:NAD(P)H-dependent oxidoreductase n=1 Tax=Alloalcanivorax TaxID=3020832 RepID=UPI0019318E68|nr:NAD(P)H-dependent oxidoreductase [Alloalcanivorax marinus]MBL7249942.1 NAD(P)H-dependent oxidoreductase [Alloalcanivorax marinus]
MGKKIAVILGSPDPASLCRALADRYAESAEQAGNEVRYFRLGEIEFDPILRHGYNQRQELEPGLLEIKDAFTWAEHVVLVFPVWWGSMPAIMKGMFDRVFLPGYAFKYRENSQLWDKLLAGRSAHVITTMDTPPWYFKLVYRSPAHNQIRRTILEFVGIKPVEMTVLGPVRYASDAKRRTWLDRMSAFARKA